MSARGVNLLVFRDTRRIEHGAALKNVLARRLALLQSSCDPPTVPDALLQAGELECALADCAVPVTEFQAITDDLAALLVDPNVQPELRKLLRILDETVAPPRLPVSSPEGFAFYGLHPLAFADVVELLPALPVRAVVVGIRSIGTTLSAVTAAALRSRGVQAKRLTVRPTGHPYSRRTEFSAEQEELTRAEAARNAQFLVVDEGPGLSGSSFICVGEALLRAGVCRQNITLISSYSPDPDRLCTENGAQRWRQFQSLAVPAQPRRPSGAQVWIGSGEWRRFVMCDHEWPASWITMERLKYLSADGADPRFYKFLGLGHYGEKVVQREEQVAAAGFGTLPKLEDDGYVSYPFVDGRPMRVSDLSTGVLGRLASYCDFRARTFTAGHADIAALQQMAEHNRRELQFDGAIDLHLQRPVIPDGRMQPHEWLLGTSGKMFKTDGGSHGDDHFFPGATDIAWDLAGAIVEWHMSPSEAQAFLEMYGRASGDDAYPRIAGYITAYTAFRYAYCAMAANAMEGTEEQARLKKQQTLLRTQDTRERPKAELQSL